jgi:ABC-type transport system involved in multi-copper enzyme maturation permease subunit
LFVGPVFQREVIIAPRRARIFIARTAYVAVLLLLIFTAWMVLYGTQNVQDIGDLARFGTILFQILAPLQLVWAAFFSAMLAAAAVAHEKDRRTLILLLLTNLSNSELVLGKLLASILNVLVMIAAAFPLFMAATLLGGISLSQIAWTFAITLTSVLACGSLGSLLALWREKTFQALALTVLVLVLWVAGWEIVAAGVLGDNIGGIPSQVLATGMSPWRAILEAIQPYIRPQPALGVLGNSINLYLLSSVAIAILLNAIAIAMVRVWNPSRESAPARPEENALQQKSIFENDNQPDQNPANSPLTKGATAGLSSSAASVSVSPLQKGATTNLPSVPGLSSSASKVSAGATAGLSSSAASVSAPARTREVWDNPIIWREIRTWAYGRKILVIRLAYLLLFALAAGSLYWTARQGQLTTASHAAIALAPLFLLSLILVNAQAVTSLTSERDVKALDLLLVTDLTPKEIVFGKLGGVLYNTKEIVLLPLLLCVYLRMTNAISLENTVFLILGLAVLYIFVAVLGIHAGITYANSGSAIAVSLGTVFFLSVGVAACMRIMLAFSGSFHAQFVPFFAYMVLGGVGLYVVLGVRNPSPAIGVASFLCPFATFYAITSYLLGAMLAVFLAMVAAYGFTTAAMLIPAIYEFDVATGRTTIDE